MRATWLTSSVAGFLFGIVAAWASTVQSTFGVVAVFAFFLGSTFSAVFGVAQYREMIAEQKARGLGRFGVLAESEDLRRYYLPVWGRMLAWFASAAVTGILAIAVDR